MKENYEDCPLREKAQYLGDIKTEAVMNTTRSEIRS